jgi:hypothetical protein
LREGRLSPDGNPKFSSAGKAIVDRSAFQEIVCNMYGFVRVRVRAMLVWSMCSPDRSIAGQYGCTMTEPPHKPILNYQSPDEKADPTSAPAEIYFQIAIVAISLVLLAMLIIGYTSGR